MINVILIFVIFVIFYELVSKKWQPTEVATHC